MKSWMYYIISFAVRSLVNIPNNHLVKSPTKSALIPFVSLSSSYSPHKIFTALIKLKWLLFFSFVKSQYISSTVDLNFSNFLGIEVHEKVSFALLLYYNLFHDVLFKSSKRPPGERSHMGHQIEMKK